MALPRWLVRLRWSLVALPPAVTIWGLAPDAPEPDVARDVQPDAQMVSLRDVPRWDAAAVLAQPAPAVRSDPSPTLARTLPSTPLPDQDPAAPGPVVAAKTKTTTKTTTTVTASVAGQEVFFGPSDGNAVALTFDDGPSEALTPWVLSSLRRANAVATFFVLGNRASKLPKVLEQIAAAGHEIGNHGWSHRSLRSMFPAEIEREIDDTNRVVSEATGQRPALFRPPFGRYAPSAIPLVAQRAMNFVLWNADGRDWDGDADAIVDRVLAQAKPGAIIVLHDSETQTARALPRILEGLKTKGLRTVSVSELTGLPSYTDPSPLTPDTDRTTSADRTPHHR